MLASVVLFAVLADIGQRQLQTVECIAHTFINTVKAEQGQQPADREGGADRVADDAEDKEGQALASMVAGELILRAEEAGQQKENAQIAQRGDKPIVAAGNAADPVLDAIGVLLCLLFGRLPGLLTLLGLAAQFFLPLLLGGLAAFVLLLGPFAAGLLLFASLLFVLLPQIPVLFPLVGLGLCLLAALIIAAGQTGAQPIRDIGAAALAVSHRYSPCVRVSVASL